MRKISANYIFPICAKPIKNGVITLNDDGKITDISALDENAAKPADVEFYEGILCPGFVNAHCHLELSHLKGLMPRGTKIIGFIEEIPNIRNTVTPEQKVEIARTEDAKMHAEGIVAVGDISNCDVTFELKKESSVYYHTFVEIFGLEDSRVSENMEYAKNLVNTAKNLGISASITPHAPYTMCDKMFDAVLANACTAGIMSIHNQETAPENDYFINGTGGFVDYYKGEGNVQTPTPIGKTSIHRTLNKITKDLTMSLIHNVFTSEEDYDCAVAKSRNITWVLCPSSNLYIESKLPPVEMLRRKGAQIALGTDSLSSNTQLSMIQEMLVIAENFQDIPVEEILKWATLNGAKSLKIDDKIGTFEVGKTPGVVLIENFDLNKMKFTKNTRAKLLF